jgi:hypothetical protein
MRRHQLEHILRAAGAITGRKEWVIVGSQAILGAVPNAPAEVTISEELDLYVPGDEEASDLVDGSIGERSPFHETFGYYAHGVGAETATLPSRWRERAVFVQSAGTEGVVGICPHPSDLAVSKLAAWRERIVNLSAHFCDRESRQRPRSRGACRSSMMRWLPRFGLGCGQ